MRLGWLRPIFDIPGPYATVVFDATRAHEDAAHEVELRWRSARERLTAVGAPDALLDAMETAALAPTGAVGDHALVLIGAGERVRLARVIPGQPVREIASWSPVPHVFPLVRAYAFAVPFVLVVADRHGADITVIGPRGDRLDEHTVEGKTWPLRKVGVGGWAHLRYQHKVENLWESNAALVAADVDTAVAESAARLVLAAGDVRAVEKLEGELGTTAKERFSALVSGGRAAGVDEDAKGEEIDRVVTQAAVAHVSEITEKYAQETGRGGAATGGLAGVVEALRRAQVETLLLRDDPSSDLTLWTSAGEPSLVAMDRAELDRLGVEDAVEDRADAVLLRALAGTDAGIALVADPTVELPQGVGAVLRYADASTT